MRGRPQLLAAVGLASLLYLVGLVHFSNVRAVDDDEGLYSTAARLVGEGETPYRDFFFQQAPLVPYAYSWVWRLHPHSLIALRHLSAALGGMAVALWGVCLLFAKRLPRKIGLATFAIVLLNPYWVAWNSVVKTFAPANLLMSIAMIGLYSAVQSDRRRWYLVGGLALGACASARALYGPMIPLVLAWLAYREWRESRSLSPKTGAFAVGAVCGLLPMLLTFAADPRAFIFNNIQYHHLDVGYHLEQGRAVVGYPNLGATILSYFSDIVVRLVILHPYFAALLTLSIVGGLSFRQRRNTQGEPYIRKDCLYAELVLVMLIAYVATALIPYPTFDQYFDGPLVPLLVPFVAEGLRLGLGCKKWKIVALALLASVLVLAEVRRDAGFYLTPGEWSMRQYRQVTDAIESNSRPGDLVLSFSPGYVFESGRHYLPGLTNNFVYHIMSLITPQERSRYHVISQEQIMQSILARAPEVIVTARQRCMAEYYANLSPEEVQALHAAMDENYSLVSKIEAVEVYRRR
jgi:hypothetical protein